MIGTALTGGETLVALVIFVCGGVVVVATLGYVALLGLDLLDRYWAREILDRAVALADVDATVEARPPATIHPITFARARRERQPIA